MAYLFQVMEITLPEPVPAVLATQWVDQFVVIPGYSCPLLPLFRIIPPQMRTPLPIAELDIDGEDSALFMTKCLW